MIHSARWSCVFALLAAAAPESVAGQTRSSYQETVASIMSRPAPGEPAIAASRVGAPRFRAPRAALPTPLDAPLTASLPAGAAAATPGPAGPQTPGIDFLGANLADSNTFPPDTNGAAGATQFLVVINGRVRTFGKASGTADGILNTTLDTFFNSVRGGFPAFSPRVRYDRLSGRWIVTTLNLTASLTNNRVLVAASNGDPITPATVWTFWFFQHNLVSPLGDTGTFFDSPTLGVDSNALVIGGNIFDSLGVYQGTSAHAVRKSTVISGAGGDLVPGGHVVAFRNLTGTPAGAGPYAPQGVDQLVDTAGTASWLAGVDNAGFGALVFRKVSYSAPGVWPPTGISANLSLIVAATALPLAVPHLGNTAGVAGYLDAVDDRLFAAHLRNGRLWTAHAVAVDGSGVSPGDRNGVRWYEIDATGISPALTQAGTLWDPAGANPTFYWIPTIAVSGQGHAALGYSVAGAAQRIDAGTVGRLAGDPPGTLQGPIAYTATAGSYNPAGDPGPTRRWGDYSHTSLDPQDDMTLWTIQEYCDANDSWGVRAVELIAPPPATPATAAPPTVASGLPSVNVVITGTSVSGSGFYDPGPGWPNRIGAAVDGSVTVNGVTYSSSTSVTLDISTVGAVLGPRIVTVTNPDGQSAASAAGIFSIVAAGPAPTVSAIAPTSGPSAGGTPVQIAGTNFVSPAGVTIGGAVASGVTVMDPTLISATTPALSPGTLNDVVVTNPDSQFDTLVDGFLSDFLDVFQAHIFHDDVETIFRLAITNGCDVGLYCVDESTNRAQMAIFLLRSKLGGGYTPPGATGTVFADVGATDFAADFIEELYAQGITDGCDINPLRYCPLMAVTRAQSSKLLLRMEFGSGYTPPAATGTVFADVGALDFAADFIEDLFALGITDGCDINPPRFCPNDPITRGSMAKFLVRTFGLVIP